MANPSLGPLAAIDLDVGGVPDGEPGPAAGDPVDFVGWSLVYRHGRDIDPAERAVFDGAAAFRAELRQPYPRCYWLQAFADNLRNSLLPWMCQIPPENRMYDEVVARSRILAYLARAFLVTRSRKNDCYSAWADCQRHLQALFSVVIRAISAVYRRRVLNGWRVVELVALGDEDAVRTVSSGDFVPDGDSDNSQDDYHASLQAHRQERREVRRQRRLAAREYALFVQYLGSHPEPEGRELIQSFRRELMDGYIAGLCPFPPVSPIGELLPEVPRHIREDDQSSVEELYDEEFEADSDGGWQVEGGRVEEGPSRVVGAVGVAGLGQGDAAAPAVYGPVVGWLVSEAARLGGPADAEDGGEDSDLETLNSDMEDLF